MRLNLSLDTWRRAARFPGGPRDASLPIAGGEPGAPLAERPALVVEGLTFRYGGLTALDAVSFDVAAGEILAVLGASGSGKSTLLRLIAGVERPAAGRIVLDGIELAGPHRVVPPERRRIGMVFQDYALFPNLTVADNVAFGLKGRPRAEIRGTVASLLDRVGLDRHAVSYPHMLSGGERQRVALARALAPQPRLLLMDEPFSSLDGPLRDSVRDQTVALLRETRTTTILVTHDPREAMRMARRLALIDRGRLVQCDAPEVLYRRPAAACAARLFGDVNEVRGVCRDGHVETPLGRFAAPAVQSATASVFIRPQHVRLAAPAAPVRGRVIETTFLGDTHHVVLDIDGLGGRLVARFAGGAPPAAGTLVGVDVAADEALVIPHDATGAPVC